MNKFLNAVLLWAWLTMISPSCKQGNNKELIIVLADQEQSKIFDTINRTFENRLFTREEEVLEIHEFLIQHNSQYASFIKTYTLTWFKDPKFVIKIITRWAHQNNYLFNFGNNSAFDQKNVLFYQYKWKINIPFNQFKWIHELFPDLTWESKIYTISDSVAHTLWYEWFHNETGVIIAEKNSNNKAIVANELTHECLIKKGYTMNILSSKEIRLEGYTWTGMMWNEFISNAVSAQEDLPYVLYQDYLYSLLFSLTPNNDSDEFTRYWLCSQVANNIVTQHTHEADILIIKQYLKSFTQSTDNTEKKQLSEKISSHLKTIINNLTPEQTKEIQKYYLETAKNVLQYRENNK